MQPSTKMVSTVVLLLRMSDGWSRRLSCLRLAAPVFALCAGGLLYLSIPDHPLLAVLNGLLLVGELCFTYVEWFVFQHEWPGLRSKYFWLTK